MAGGSVKLPPGFEIEDQAAPGGSNLPPGFELESGAAVPADVPKWKSAALGASQGASLNFGDEGAAATVALAKKLKDIATGKDSGAISDNYVKARDALRAKIDESQAANPKTFLGGEFVGGAATAPIMGEATIPKMIAQGAIQGLGASNADLTKGDVGGAARDAAIGGGIGGAFGLAGKALSALTPEALKNLARSSSLRALGYTKRFLNSPAKQAAANQTAETLLGENMIKPLDSAEDLQAKVQDLIKSSGQKIGGYLKRMGSGYSKQSAIDAVESLRPTDSGGNILKGGLYDEMNGALDNALETINAHGDVIPFEEANKLKGLLQKAGKFGSSSAQKDMERSIAGVTRQSIDDTLENMAKNPNILQTEPMVGTGSELAPAGGGVNALPPDESMSRFEDFLKQKKLYKAGQEAEDALNNRLSSEQGNKRFGLTDTITAAPMAAAEMATGHMPLATGAAVGVKKLGERYGNTTTAYFANKAANFGKSTFDKLSGVLRTNPEALGKYAGMFAKAAGMGGQEVATRHWVLSNTDPEYRMMLNGLSDKNGQPFNPSSGQ